MLAISPGEKRDCGISGCFGRNAFSEFRLEALDRVRLQDNRQIGRSLARILAAPCHAWHLEQFLSSSALPSFACSAKAVPLQHARHNIARHIANLFSRPYRAADPSSGFLSSRRGIYFSSI